MHFEDHVEDLVRRLTADLLELIREAAYASVTTALDEAEPLRTQAAGQARPLGARAAGQTRPAPQRAATREARGPGQKRPREQLQATVELLAEHIDSYPGSRIEQIGKALGVNTRDLALPVKKLLAAGRIRREGQKRSTTYFPA